MKKFWRRAGAQIRVSGLGALLLSFLLLCFAVAGVVLAIVSWGPEWLGNIASAVVIALITTVAVDGMVVARRRAKGTALGLQRRTAVLEACHQYIEQVERLAEPLVSGSTASPESLSGPFFRSESAAEDLDFRTRRLEQALVGWTAQTGLGFVNTRTAQLDKASAVFGRKYREARLAHQRMLDGAMAPAARRAAERARASGTTSADKLKEILDGIVKVTSACDVQGQVRKRIRRKLPRWLRVAAGMITVGWAGLLISAAVLPTPLPPDFIAQNLANLTADAAVGLFAGGITLALSEARRFDQVSHLLPAAQQISQMGMALFGLSQRGDRRMRAVLHDFADRISDLVEVIMVERPNAELASQAAAVVHDMRELARSREPLWNADSDYRKKYSAEILDPVLALTEVAGFRLEGAENVRRFPTEKLQNILLAVANLSGLAHGIGMGDTEL